MKQLRLGAMWLGALALGVVLAQAVALVGQHEFYADRTQGWPVPENALIEALRIAGAILNLAPLAGLLALLVRRDGRQRQTIVVGVWLAIPIVNILALNLIAPILNPLTPPLMVLGQVQPPSAYLPREVAGAIPVGIITGSLQALVLRTYLRSALAWVGFVLLGQLSNVVGTVWLIGLAVNQQGSSAAGYTSETIIFVLGPVISAVGFGVLWKGNRGNSPNNDDRDRPTEAVNLTPTRSTS